MSITTIEWTDRVWNPVRGCVKVSAGCKNCYAETFAERWRGVKGHAYEQGFDLRLVPEKLDEPLRWKNPARIFVNSMSDLFQDGVPDDFIAAVFATMSKAHHHTYQILTKRPERMMEWMTRYWEEGNNKVAIDNIWLGVSVENQEQADARVPLLLRTPAAVRWISAEPLLGPLEIFNKFTGDALYTSGDDYNPSAIDWVVCGGESGPNARPFNLIWANDIRIQCQQVHDGVPFFMKQMGSNAYCGSFEAHRVTAFPEDRIRYKSRKGGDMSEWPKDLRVREFPNDR